MWKSTGEICRFLLEPVHSGRPKTKPGVPIDQAGSITAEDAQSSFGVCGHLHEVKDSSADSLSVPCFPWTDDVPPSAPALNEKDYIQDYLPSGANEQTNALVKAKKKLG